MSPAPTGRLAASGYAPPARTIDVQLDLVTPTCNRPKQIVGQAALLGPQMQAADRWIVVDDASAGGAVDPRELAACLPSPSQLMFAALSFAKGDTCATVNQARHVGCSMARRNSWIVEIDDHDPPTGNCLELIRAAICRGAVFIYGDCLWSTPDGHGGTRYSKPDYHSYMLRDEGSPCEGVRAFPAWLYRAVGGYRWEGDRRVGCNEFPAGDYGLFLRMELWCEGQGFWRIPEVLCTSIKVPGGISTKHLSAQADMANAMRRAAQQGELAYQ